MELQRLSYYEKYIMKALWDVSRLNGRGKATCKEVLEYIGRGYKVTTIYTFLDNLEKKGYLSKSRKGLTQYEPIISLEEYVFQEINGIRDLWFNGSVTDLAAYIDCYKKLF